jgi:glycosyltransferase involved in cell wall biosynthesis
MAVPGTMNDDITVVVTCFNDGRFLTEALASAAEQEGGKPQLIVVDDGSTDSETLDALERATAEAQVIRQANAGTPAARNTGLAAAATRYTILLDADDRLAPSAMRLLRSPLDRDPKLGFSYGLTRFFGAWEGALALPAYDPYKLLYRSLVGSTALMRREVLADVGGFDPAFLGYEDWEFWLHALAQGWRGQRVEDVTLFYRRHGDTRHEGARGNYRVWYRALRRKHHVLYEDARRRELAAESDLGPVGRAVYRWWWGARPLPARLELALQGILWRPGSASAEPAPPDAGAVR